jgi:aryl-alcohol dehydrogenase-like predicted oxidoreductase
LHKATLELLEDFQVSKAFDHAQKAGVQQLGVSVSDVETGFKAASDNRFDYIQLPYNSEKSDLLPVIESTKAAQKQILFNRPLAMGGLAHSMKKAYWFIIKTQASGVILSGTANPEHLQENLRAFQSCL